MGRDVSDILKLCIALMKRLNYYFFFFFFFFYKIMTFFFFFFLQNYDLLKLRKFSGYEYRMTS